MGWQLGDYAFATLDGLAAFCRLKRIKVDGEGARGSEGDQASRQY
jgi:hypothetical protein